MLAVFGQHGWAGLSIDAVATHAGIGKSTIYLRWKTKRALLLEAVRYFETRRENPVDDGRPLREYLIEYCLARGRLLLGPHAPTMLHIAAGAITHPEDFQEIRRESITRGTLPIVARILRAVIDGELPEDTDSGQLLDMSEGALVFHLVIAPLGATREELEDDLERYVRTLVDKALRTVDAAGAREASSWQL
ncbi:TetR family transcriptional regulator [Georgenia soli]|uniref:TetR family transcriptional regulator n=1 Tax=Georgenia soli TaxID=638953 RepID=A0A2A9F2T2_9MICO|nr:TetR/AcrR family transcriptional regulator [Georgenia soli]PFG45126.1 TetR family transcriptional regulator [Georgenia soli]